MVIYFIVSCLLIGGVGHHLYGRYVCVTPYTGRKRFIVFDETQMAKISAFGFHAVSYTSYHLFFINLIIKAKISFIIKLLKWKPWTLILSSQQIYQPLYFPYPTRLMQKAYWPSYIGLILLITTTYNYYYHATFNMFSHAFLGIWKVKRHNFAQHTSTSCSHQENL